jgi:hypothetical protein
VTFGVCRKVIVSQDGEDESQREDQDDSADGDAATLVGANRAPYPRLLMLRGANPDGDVIVGSAV